MPYQVFALKWRPKSFDDIVGQNHIVTTLKNALTNNRLAHAYIFAGPRGVGKTSTARILAKALNCKNGPTINPCQKCSACAEITQGRSLDVIEIDGASNRGIDEIRTLRENVKFAPVNGKFKIYIIDEVHMLTTEAFNALLKTLEEPPEFVKFIFATTQPHKVISTILSRCQRLDFRRVPLMEISGQLEKIVKSEKINVDKDVLFAIARSSDGSLRDAESLLDQLASFSRDKLSVKDVVSVLGLVEQDVLFGITDKIIQKDALGALDLFNQIIDEGKDIGVFLTSFIEHFRNLMLAKVTQADVKLIDLPQDICQKLLEQSRAFSLEEIFFILNLLVNTQEMSKRFDSPRIPLEITMVKLAHDKKSLTHAAPPIKPTSHIEHAPAPKDKEPVEPKKQEDGPPASDIQCASLEQVSSLWQNIVDNISKVKMSAATYLNEGSPTKCESNLLTISFPQDCVLHKESLERKENKIVIEDIISELLKIKVRVNFALSREMVPKEEGESSPFIKSVLDTFKGRVISEGY